MMLGKRGRPTFRRTTSMTGISFDVEAPPPPPLGLGGVYDHMMLSPRYFRRNDSSGDAETADFLRSCGLCNRRLAPGRDIYMYRGDTAFCSLECREQQMKQDERKERRAAAAAAASVAKDGDSHHQELGAAAPEAETVAAA
ncbi:UNVERIFIED_CONTAM: FCS-Like Zinc finger 5 [Sesamum latifolium]|uniref:FCS-Like Zinc finger 5 n=1 Tax=Sesamum latifolium TaxID=2727402 RepID=A0AAW2Y644_9LAMI